MSEGIPSLMYQKLHKLDIFWKCAQVKTAPLKSPGAKDPVYGPLFWNDWLGQIPTVPIYSGGPGRPYIPRHSDSVYTACGFSEMQMWRVFIGQWTKKTLAFSTTIRMECKVFTLCSKQKQICYIDFFLSKFFDLFCN